MPKQIINITLLVVIEEVENFLDDLCHAALFCLAESKINISQAQLRQKIIERAIGKIPNRYKVMDWVPNDARNTSYRYSSLEQRLYIETLIHEVIVEDFPQIMLSNKNTNRASGLAVKIP